jgi:hypothetical protein
MVMGRPPRPRESTPAFLWLTPAELSAWRERLSFNKGDAAHALGCSRSAWAGWKAASIRPRNTSGSRWLLLRSASSPTARSSRDRNQQMRPTLIAAIVAIVASPFHRLVSYANQPATAQANVEKKKTTNAADAAETGETVTINYPSSTIMCGDKNVSSCGNSRNLLLPGDFRT